MFRNFWGKNDCNTGWLVLINRVAAARKLLQRFDIDAIIYSNIKDIRYLTGFTGSEGLLLLSLTDTYLLVDSRYTTQAREEAAECNVVEVRERMPALASLLSGMGVVKLGFQADAVTVSQHNEFLRSLPDYSLVPLGAELGTLRTIKDRQEIELLAQTAAFASEALLGMLSSVRPGMTERELALGLEFAMRSAGADDKAFDFIVASGERGALPHGRASEKAIRAGELVTIDFGAAMDGYNSDETVTVAVGEPDARQREIYRIVKDAHDMAIDTVRPGVSLKELDAVARNHIAGKGYGDYFGHGLGHGVGLDIHEKPVVSFRSEDEAREGMVFTIEPGIYIPGWGGVRIEDTVCVTADGCRLLTRVPKDLMVL